MGGTSLVPRDQLPGSGLDPLNSSSSSTWQHGHFFNTTCNMGPYEYDKRLSIIMVCDRDIYQNGQWAIHFH